MLELVQPHHLAPLAHPQPPHLLQRPEQHQGADAVPGHDGPQPDGVPGQHGEGLGGAGVQHSARAEDGAGDQAPDACGKKGSREN